MSNVVLFSRAEDPKPRLVIWSGIDKDAGHRTWVVDYVDETGTAFTIGVTPSFSDVIQYVTAWEKDH